MSHLEEGTLLTIRDDGLVSAEARVHVEGCATCRAALAAARDRARSVSEALDSLAGDVPVDVEAAKARVRRRLDRRREASHRRMPALARALGRAAALLLLASGVVYALPDSPLRAWLDEIVAPTADPTPVDDGSPTVDEGVELDVPLGGLRIVLTSVETEQRLEITWGGGERVRLVAAPGSRYSVSTGSARAEVASGIVRIVLPRSAAGPVIIEADGRMLLRSVDGNVDVLGEVLSRDADRIVLSLAGG